MDEMEESRWEFPARCECVRLYAQGSPSPSGRRIVRGSKGSSRTEPHPRRMFSAPTPCCGLPTGLARELSDPGGSTRSDAQGEPSRADTRCETHQASTTPHRSKPGTAWRACRGHGQRHIKNSLPFLRKSSPSLRGQAEIRIVLSLHSTGPAAHCASLWWGR